MSDKRQILKRVWGFKGDIMRLDEALPYLRDGRHAVALPLWFGEDDGDPLPGGLDWIDLINIDDDVYTINRKIEPGVRERVEQHPPDALVVVFKFSEAKEKP